MLGKGRKPSKPAAAGSNADGIPNAELDVLTCVWKEGPVTARRIREMMKRYRPMAHGSVVTLLSRLESKGHVSREKGQIGKAFLFRARTGPEITHRKMLRDFLGRVFDGDITAMIAAVLEAEPPTPEQLVDIQKLVASARTRTRRKP